VMSGWPVDDPGLPSRALVAQLAVSHADGRRRGSGYQVGRGAVLTAAHLLHGATAVEVTLAVDLPGRRAVSSTSWWVDEDSDLAVVSIDELPETSALGWVRFGRVGERAAVLEGQAVGFPLWKMRIDDGSVPAPGDDKPGYRDAVHAVGTVAALSNWREGTLEFLVPTPPQPLFTVTKHRRGRACPVRRCGRAGGSSASSLNITRVMGSAD
jgi:hypothetical protein